MSDPRLVPRDDGGVRWTYEINERDGTVTFHKRGQLTHGPRTYDEFLEWFAATDRDPLRHKNHKDYQAMMRVCRDELLERGLIPEE